jgi:three-Cys-motif partner protein
MDADVVGIWSEIKVEIVRAYATEYSKIMSAHKFRHLYIDAFAGPGVNLSRTSGEYIPGSPLNAAGGTTV